jgi:GntR family transcriptional regulator/MocR family aminotransferase
VDGSLTSPLRRSDPESLQRQIARRLREAIADGRLRPSARLTSTRVLARDLGVARITVQTAYDQLVAEGYLEVDGRRSTRVAADLPDRGFATGRPTTDRRDDERFPERNPWAAASPITPPDRAIAAPVELGPEWFGLQVFDRRRWERLIVRAWRELSNEPDGGVASYAGPPGDTRLRAALADHLAVRRGVRCRADDVAVTAGSTAAFAAIARTWLGPGRVCVVEDPGGGQLRRALGGAGARIVPVPVDDRGIRVDRLPDRATVAFVTPSWQYPAGGSLSLPRRLALLRWASDVGAIIVEDDCESELRYDGTPMPSLQGLAADGRVIYVGTFSKVLYPGLRTGYMVLSSPHRGPLLAALEAGGRAPAAVEQRALAMLMEGGGFHRHIQRLRVTYAERRDAFAAGLRATGAGLEVRRASAGGHLIVGIVDPRWTATILADALALLGIRVEPLAANRSLAADDDELVVYISRLDAAALRTAGQRIGERALGGPPGQPSVASLRSTAGRIPPAR